MPGFPAYFLLAVSTLLLVPTLGAYLAGALAAGSRAAVDRRLVIGLAVGLALVPLVVVALVRPIGSPAKAIVVDNVLTPGRRRNRRRRPRRRRGARPSPGRIRRRVERRLLPRLPHRPGRHRPSSAPTTAAPRSATSRWCCSERRASRRWRDGSPPPGSRYRIGVAANSRNDPDAPATSRRSAEPVEATPRPALALGPDALLEQREPLRQDHVLVGELRDHGRVVQQHGEDEERRRRRRARPAGSR